ncbi:unnamed protein product [Haemonchus placei]|uniref:Rab3 GTPase-activating protein catalytic subunit n=1 Tax=Haemonchus placei TaxID=6290 RepID=A0A0N4WSW8_HAEPC|nr:unnamed protein product [Haemonchus placei]
MCLRGLVDSSIANEYWHCIMLVAARRALSDVGGEAGHMKMVLSEATVAPDEVGFGGGIFPGKPVRPQDQFWFGGSRCMAKATNYKRKDRRSRWI